MNSQTSVNLNVVNGDQKTKNVVLQKTHFQVIFPQYIDAMLSPKQGRRLTKTQAVVSPTVEEMLQALHHLGYKTFIRDSGKSYPRSQGDFYFPLTPKECIRVSIKQPRDVHYIKKSEFDTEEREATVGTIPNKMELLRQIAAWIKKNNPQRPRQPTVEEVMEALSMEGLPNGPKKKAKK